METALPIAIDRLSELSPEERERLLRRAGAQDPEVARVASEIVADVRARGDSALLDHTEMLDGVRPERLEVGGEELASVEVTSELLEALAVAHENLRAFHEAQLRPQPVVETRDGIRVWREWRAVERVGVYVPGGAAVYPSTVLMNLVPAKVAGCEEVVMVSPPGRDGRIPPPTLAAARLAGADRVFGVGGAQAIAALAYGTESVPRVHKIFGAGNAYVTAAKMQVFGDVDIDLPAGPSELLVIADDGADPRLVALDLMAQSEHRPDSASVLVTTSARLAESAAQEMARELGEAPRAGVISRALQAYGRILVVDSMEEAIGFSNEYAPEHLSILTKSPRGILCRITNAGSIFLGPYSPVAAGDYVTGGNHVLPTGGHARTFAPLSVEDFGRWVQVQEVTADGLRSVARAITTLARTEGLETHARSVEARLE